MCQVGGKIGAKWAPKKEAKSLAKPPKGVPNGFGLPESAIQLEARILGVPNPQD